MLIRDIPEDIHEELVAQAARDHRSAEKQVIFLIKTGLRKRRPVEETLKEAERVRALCTREITMEEVLAITEAPH